MKSLKSEEVEKNLGTKAAVPRFFSPSPHRNLSLSSSLSSQSVAQLGGVS